MLRFADKQMHTVFSPHYIHDSPLPELPSGLFVRPIEKPVLDTLSSLVYG